MNTTQKKHQQDEKLNHHHLHETSAKVRQSERESEYTDYESSSSSIRINLVEFYNKSCLLCFHLYNFPPYSVDSCKVLKLYFLTLKRGARDIC
jgi:hypothetical protein